jgi:hypothetical protein
MLDIEAYVDAAAAAIGLSIAAEHRPGVLHYVELVAAMAPRVMDFPLAVADEGANVFMPVSAPARAVEDPA